MRNDNPRSKRPSKRNSSEKSERSENSPRGRNTGDLKKSGDYKKPGDFKKDFDSKKEGGYTKKFNFKKKSKVMANKAVDDKIRLNKFLASAGIASRREADKLIESGVVTINGNVVTEMGTKVAPGDTVHYGGQLLQSQKKQYVLLNKPKNYITTMDDPEERQTVMELVSKACNERIYPVGRLDRATSGLLLFTNDGEMTKRLTHPSGKVKKIYLITVDKNVTQNDLIKLVSGVDLEDGMATPDKAFYLPNEKKSTISIELHSGKNRIIRRMMESMGYKVTKLDRIQFAGLTKKDLIRGRFRHLTEKEIGFLHRLCGLQPQESE